MQTPWGDLEVSDAHVHFFSRRFIGALAAQGGREARGVAEIAGWEFPGSSEELTERWAVELDRHGVSSCSLIASVPGDEESVLTAVALRPQRFYAFAMVNPMGERTPMPAGLNAICLFPAMHLYSMHDTRVGKLLEEAAGLGCAVFVHCGVLTVGIRKKLGLPSLFDMRYSNPLDLHEAAMRFPQVSFVVPHFGAGYFRESLMLADLCPNVYLDTSSSNSWMRYEGLDLETVFQRALAAAGPRRLLFGTDSSFFPRGWNRAVFDAQVAAVSGLGVSAEDAALIFGGNLRRIFAKS